MSSSLHEPTVICVLGMSRTGTSLTARVLSLAGVYLGPQRELLQKDLHQLAGESEATLALARETNPEGFWKHYRIMRLNERILRALGGNWREPPDLPPGWEGTSKLAAERAEARALLEESFGGHRLWGWKDPRNSLTLPFWRQFLPHLHCVVCLRNPVDVAASLQRRDKLSFAQGVDLWTTYVSNALANTSAGPRLLVPYESYFDDPQATAMRLAAFAGCSNAFEDADDRRALAEAVDESLWRHRTSVRDVVCDARLSAEAISLFRSTQLL